MECGRRRRCNHRNNCRQRSPSCAPAPCEESPCRPKSGCFLSKLCSFLILSALMALVYLMLEYHCTTCKAKCDMTCIKKNIEDITKNLLDLKEGYHDLEIQISKFSNELPRVQGQLQILESLANTLEASEFGWNPKSQYTLPNVDVYLTQVGCNGKNTSRLVKSVAYMDDCRDSVCPNTMLLNNVCPNSVCPNSVCPNSMCPNSQTE